MSMTRRLIVQLMLFVAVFWTAAALISRTIVVREINEIVAADLSQAANRIMPLVTHVLSAGPEPESGGESGEPPQLEEDMRFMTAGAKGFLAFEVRDRTGRVRLRSYDAGDLAFPDKVAMGLAHSGNLSTYAVPDAATGLTLIVAAPDARRNEAIYEATMALFVPLLLVLLAMAGGGILIARSAMVPVRDLRRRIATRGGSNFDPVESESQPAELRPIANAVDRLLERLQKALDAERIFAASSAHELRTPIAGVLAQVQRLKAELGDGPGAARVAKIEAALKRLSQLTGKLLQLSTAEAGLGPRETRENMSQAFDLVIRDFTDSAESPLRVEVENHLGQDLMVAMDADSFAIALRNLLENAARHGAPGAPVKVVIGEDWTIHVCNHGPVVPPDRLEGLKQRFARGETEAEGSGLGLSIVERIMSRSGGSLTLASPIPGEADGFEAVLHLP